MPTRSDSHLLYHLDDDPLFLQQVRDILATGGLDKRLRSSSQIADFLQTLKEDDDEPSVILLDIYLDGRDKDSRSIVKQLRARYPQTLIIMCSDLQDIVTVRECMARGADDFLFKSQDEKQLLERIVLAEQEYNRRQQQQQQIKSAQSLPHVAGRTARDLCERIPRLLESALSSIHVFGETGTGKEIVADIFAHFVGRQYPFLRIHCGAIPTNLLESELFGHVKGAFTGAHAHKIGLFEKANGGWVFLDEVATLTSAAQISLLRVLENQELRPVGANVAKSINVRVLSATNEDLEALAAEGKFRRDLWQRLCETTIALPPLRERMDEVEELVQFFSSTMRGGPYQVSNSALQVLKQYPWSHGNIRELRNCLRAMTEQAYGGVLSPAAIPPYIWEQLNPAKKAEADNGQRISLPLANPLRFEELKTQLLIALIRHCFDLHGRMTLRQLAKLIDVPRSTLSTKLQELVQEQSMDADALRSMVNVQAEAKV